MDLVTINQDLSQDYFVIHKVKEESLAIFCESILLITSYDIIETYERNKKYPKIKSI